MAIIGELGAGKTLCLTYMCYRNYLKGKKIFSNYELKFPHTKVKELDDLLNMKEGFAGMDELWLWVDCRASASKKNRVISAILLKSRKRGIHICYVTQAFRQVDVRIRNVTDFIGIPMLSPREDWCRFNVITNPGFDLVKSYTFPTAKYFQLFDTREEIDPMDF